MVLGSKGSPYSFGRGINTPQTASRVIAATIDHKVVGEVLIATAATTHLACEGNNQTV